MNQTRTLLIFAWLMVAILLWMEWRKEANVEAASRLAARKAARCPRRWRPGGVGPAAPARPWPAGRPGAAAQAQPRPVSGSPSPPTSCAWFGEGNVVDAALLRYPQTRDEDNPPVKLFETDPARWYAARAAG